jgi:hypothetical protein
MAIVTRTAQGARETVRQKRERDQELLVWPDLVFVEFICAVLFTVTFVLLSVVVDAPLLNQANANITPNPSKAPWYLLNLQELLLHMDKGLAGVIVPTVALVVLAGIPYMDRSNDGQGVWFGTKNAVRIAGFSFVYASLFLVVCLLWDDGAHVRIYQQAPVTANHLGIGTFEDGEENEPKWLSEHNPFEDGAKLGFLNFAEGALKPTWDFVFLRNRVALRDEWQFSMPVPYQPGSGEHDGRLDWPEDFRRVPIPLNGTWLWHWDEPDWMPGWVQRIYWHDRHFDIPAIMAEFVMPIAAILGGGAVLLLILFKLGWAATTRDAFIAIFTGFILTYFALTIIGAAFRGRGQELVPPTHVPNLEEDPTITREYAPPWAELALIDVRTGAQV